MLAASRARVAVSRASPSPVVSAPAALKARMPRVNKKPMRVTAQAVAGGPITSNSELSAGSEDGFGSEVSAKGLNYTQGINYPTAGKYVSRFKDDEPRKGCDVLVECLEREGVDLVFAYPGGASMEIHQALTRSERIRNILCRHEQGEIFAAEGFAKVTGRTSVCIATSGPGATNLVTGLADSLLDSIPMVAITGQVPRAMIGTDAFQETPIVEITRQITKHNYLVTNLDDLPRIMREAFFLANSGRPGPVLVDMPKDLQQQMCVPNWDFEMKLDGYISRLPPTVPGEAVLQQIIHTLTTSERPMLYVGGGIQDASVELREFVDLTGIPVTSTLMGLGSYPGGQEMCLDMLGMHGTVVANYSIDRADLLLAMGVRFDDRVTGKLEKFAANSRIVHVDIDPAEINKNKTAHMPVCADTKTTLIALNRMLKEQKVKLDYTKWRDELNGVRTKFPMQYPPHVGEVIQPQHAIEVLHQVTGGKAIISTGVGQHQMFAAQWYPFPEPRNWATSGGLGSMGFGLPAAIGAQVARPNDLVVDIDGDGSFLMNIQELATLHAENIPVKMMILNNQFLGMVVQWEDRFYKANRAHTYLGSDDADYSVTGEEADIFPNFVKIAEGFRVPSKRVTRRCDLKAAIEEMVNSEGPYLLDVMVPHESHVLPMIPGGGSFKDIITTGSGYDEF